MSINCKLECRWMPIIKNKTTHHSIITTPIPFLELTKSESIKTLNYDLNNVTSQVITIPSNSKSFSYSIVRNGKIIKSKNIVNISTNTICFNTDEHLIFTYYNNINDYNVPHIINTSNISFIENTSSTDNTLTLNFY